MGTANYEEDDEIEIDLLELLFELKKKLLWIVLAGVIGAAAFGFYSKLILTPKYASTAMMYILSKETTLTSLADLQIGSQLTKDYKVMVTSRPVLEKVIVDLDLDCDYEELREDLVIDNPKDTRILSISTENSDPQLAADIVNTVADRSSEYIGEIMEMVPPKMVEEGIAATVPVSPKILKNAVIGGIIGILLVCGIVALRVIMNDTIRTEEDITKYLNISTLAEVPASRKNEGKGEKRR
jgi:capsular polysaccharide biosynthesis protein